MALDQKSQELLFLIIILIGLIFITFIIVYNDSYRNRTALKGDFLSTDQQAGFRIDSSLGPNTVSFPLFFDSYWMIRAYLSPSLNPTPGAYFDAIADTGSSRFLVSSSNCKTCPSKDGIWAEEWTNKSLGRSGRLDSISFGGGQNTVFEMITGYVNSIDAKFGIISSSISGVDGQVYNVCGLALGGQDGFLESLLDDQISPILTFDFNNRKMTIGSTGNLPSVRIETNLVQLNGLGHIPVAEISSINGKKLSKQYYAIFDTGTNYSLIPQEFLGSGNLEIKFPGNKENILKIGGDSYIKPGSIDRGGSGLVAREILLFGAMSFSDRILQIDYNRKKISLT